MAQQGECTKASLQAVVSGHLVKLRFSAAVEPNQAVPLSGGCRMACDGVNILDEALVVFFLPDPCPCDRLLRDQLPEVLALISALWQHGDEPAAFAGDIAHVLPCGQLRVGDVEKVNGALQLSQQVPGLAMRLVVGEVPVAGEEVHRYGAVSRHGEVVEELFEIGPVVLVVAPSDRMDDLAPPCALLASAFVAPAEGDGRGVVVKFLEIDLELLDHVDDDGKDYRGAVRFEEPVEAAANPVVVEMWDVTGLQPDEVRCQAACPFSDTVDRLPGTDVVPDQEQDAVHRRDFVPQVAWQVVTKQLLDLGTLHDSVENWQRADGVGNEGDATGLCLAARVRSGSSGPLPFFSLHARQSAKDAPACQQQENGNYSL